MIWNKVEQSAEFCTVDVDDVLVFTSQVLDNGELRNCTYRKYIKPTGKAETMYLIY